ncbi:MAG: hypothetical protein AAF710_00250 [Planctomycetota bacterium]
MCTAVIDTASADPLSPNFGGLRALPADYFGVNQNTVQNPAWRSNPGGTQLIEDLNFTSVRYPGGTVSSYFQWWTGTSPQGSPGRPEFKYELEDLSFLYEQTGTTPIFVLNMINGGGLDRQIEQLTEAAALGVPIRRVELGNEYYLDDDHWASVYPDGQSYGTTAKDWAAEIRRQFPEAEIAAIGAVQIGSTDPDSRRGKWNREVWQTLQTSDIDAITLHYYTGSGLFGGRVNAPNKWGSPEEQASQYDKFLAPDGPDVFIRSAFQYLDSVERNTEIPGGPDLWITEHSLFDRNGTVRHTWAHGMFTAALQMQMLQDFRVTQTSYHNLYNQAKMFGLSFDSASDFDGLDPSLPITQDFNPLTYQPQQYDLTSSGHAMKMFGKALDGADRVQKIWFSDPDNWVTVEGDRHPAIMAVRIFDDDTEERRVLILNLSGDDRPFDTSLWVDGNSLLEMLYADPRLHITHPSLFTETLGEVLDTTLLPAYSITLITDPVGSGVVPEPTAATLLVTTLALVGVRRRTRAT